MKGGTRAAWSGPSIFWLRFPGLVAGQQFWQDWSRFCGSISKSFKAFGMKWSWAGAEQKLVHRESNTENLNSKSQLPWSSSRVSEPIVSPRRQEERNSKCTEPMILVLLRVLFKYHPSLQSPSAREEPQQPDNDWVEKTAWGGPHNTSSIPMISCIN